MLKTIILPRHARKNHRDSSQQTGVRGVRRKAYDKAAAALSRSYSQLKPVIEGQARLRKRAITGGGGGGGGGARGGAGAGFDGRNAAAKKSARFVGDVTRLRQTACHPQIVRRSDSMFGGKRLTMQEIMAKLIERERSSACAAAVGCLRAQIVEAIVAIAPATPTKGSKSEAVYLALWDAEMWTKLSDALDRLEEQGATTQEEQRAQRKRDTQEATATATTASSEDAEEKEDAEEEDKEGAAATAAAAAAKDSSSGAKGENEQEDEPDVTKAWAKLRTELAALRKFMSAQTALAEAATTTTVANGATDTQQHQENAGDDDGTEQTGGAAATTAGAGAASGPGSRPGATSAASRRARSSTAAPKLFSQARSLIRRPDGGARSASLLCQLTLKSIILTRTGSGQTQEKSRKEMRFLQGRLPPRPWSAGSSDVLPRWRTRSCTFGPGRRRRKS